MLELQPLGGEIEEFRAQDEVELTVIRSRVWSKGYRKGYLDGLDHGKCVIPKVRQMGIRDQAGQTERHLRDISGAVIDAAPDESLPPIGVILPVEESSKDLIGGHYGNLRVEHGVTLSVDGPDGELKSGIEEEIEKLTGAGLFTAATAEADEQAFRDRIDKAAGAKALHCQDAPAVMLDTAAKMLEGFARRADKVIGQASEDRNATAEDG